MLLLDLCHAQCVLLDTNAHLRIFCLNLVFRADIQLAIQPAAPCVPPVRNVPVPLCCLLFARTVTAHLRQALHAIHVPLDTNAAPKMRTFLQCLVLKANFLFQHQQTVPFVQLGMPAKLPVTQGRFAPLVPLHSLVTDFALFALPGISVPIHQNLPFYAPKATFKIRWDQPTAPFVLLVTFAKTVLSSPLFVQKVSSQ